MILVMLLSPYWAKTIRAILRKKKLDRIYQEKHLIFDGILCNNSPYYLSLGPDGRERFLKRVMAFMECKDFQYVDLEPEEKMPLLVSAVAVQLTFGLENYLLDYFNIIYILRDNYRYGSYNVPFEGHVSQDGIYLSWNNFLRELSDYTDGQNLGLHEMAHALTYVNFTVEEGRDNSFYRKFSDFSIIARPVFEKMQSGETNLLDPYAATGYQEFWAVSIENFFERSAAFQAQLPDLYSALSKLLNQDPLSTEKLLSVLESD
jgi:Mlc titration factor MtfA (ptsG expression regulator)